jgi:Domain of unknown function (DUF4160)
MRCTETGADPSKPFETWQPPFVHPPANSSAEAIHTSTDLDRGDGRSRFCYRNGRLKAHFHAHYQDEVAIFNIDPVEIIAGSLPRRQRRLVEVWAERHVAEATGYQPVAT